MSNKRAYHDICRLEVILDDRSGRARAHTCRLLVIGYSTVLDDRGRTVKLRRPLYVEQEYIPVDCGLFSTQQKYGQLCLNFVSKSTYLQTLLSPVLQ